MSKPEIFIFNGPPRSGKDVACKYLSNKYSHLFTHMEMKRHLISLALSISGIREAVWNEHYEFNKDLSWDELGGLSQRQFLIKISEEWIKPVFGSSYFGEREVKFLKSVGLHLPTYGTYLPMCYSDGGFYKEWEPFTKDFELILVRIHRDGYDFSKDSRSYLTGDIFKAEYDIQNNGTLEEFYTKIESVLLDLTEKT